MKRVVTLLGAAHPGPAFAVTLLAGLLGVAVGLGPADLVLVVAAVLTGQLSIGWSNDLIDAQPRPRASGGPTSRWRPASSTSGSSGSPARSRSSRPSPLSLLTGVVGRAGAAPQRRVGVGLQPRAQVDRLVVGAVRRRVRRPAGLRLPGRQPGPRCRPGGWPPRVRCSASVRTSSTCCPTSRTTPRPGSAGCRTGSARGGSSAARGRRARRRHGGDRGRRVGRARGGRGRRWSSWEALAVVALVTEGRTPFRAAIAIALVDVVLLVGAR